VLLCLKLLLPAEELNFCYFWYIFHHHVNQNNYYLLEGTLATKNIFRDTIFEVTIENSVGFRLVDFIFV